jgi:hypothetical protein
MAKVQSKEEKISVESVIKETAAKKKKSQKKEKKKIRKT